MTFDEMQFSMRELHDNQVVQGQLLHRVEMNLDRLEQKLEGLGERVDLLAGIVEQNSRAIAKLADGFDMLQAAMTGMVQSIDGLSATVDRFIRGMEHNGHRPPENGPERAGS